MVSAMIEVCTSSYGNPDEKLRIQTVEARQKEL